MPDDKTPEISKLNAVSKRRALRRRRRRMNLQVARTRTGNDLADGADIASRLLWWGILNSKGSAASGELRKQLLASSGVAGAVFTCIESLIGTLANSGDAHELPICLAARDFTKIDRFDDEARARDEDLYHLISAGGTQFTLDAPQAIVDPYGLATEAHRLPVIGLFPVRFLVRLRGAASVGGLLVMTKQGHVLQEPIEKSHMRHVIKPNTSYEVVGSNLKTSLLSRVQRVRFIGEPAMWCTGIYGSGYGDAIVRYVASIPTMRVAGLPGYKIVIGQSNSASIAPLLEAVGIPSEDIIIQAPDELIFFNELYVPSSPWGHFWNDHMTLSLTEYDSFHPARIFVRGFPGVTSPKRLYVTRRLSPRRRLVNENDVIAVMQRHGFQVVEMEKLSMAEKIALLQDTEVLAGPFGTGLLNGILAPKLKSLVLLMHPAFAVNASGSARIIRVPKYYFAFGRTAGPESSDPGRGSFEIDVPSLDSFLDELLGTSS